MQRVAVRAAAALLVAGGFGHLGADRLDAGSASVSVVDFAFQPGGVEVPVGGSVSWSNAGETDHTVTADNGSFDSGTLAPGAGFSTTFSTAGTFSYFCSIHPEMQGTVTVTGAAPPDPATTPESSTTPAGGGTPSGSSPVGASPTVTG